MKFCAEWYYYQKNFLLSGYESMNDKFSLVGPNEMVRLENEFIKSIDSRYVSKIDAINETKEWNDDCLDLVRIFRGEYLILMNDDINSFVRYKRAMAVKLRSDKCPEFEDLLVEIPDLFPSGS
jgi:hypothetical protein